MALCFPLVLLISFLCTAELRAESDKEIIGKQAELQRAKPENAFNEQQTCTQDIHSVLREMSASLAGQKVEIRILQKENEGTVWEVVRGVITTTDLLQKVFIITCHSSSFTEERNKYYIISFFSTGNEAERAGVAKEWGGEAEATARRYLCIYVYLYSHLFPLTLFLKKKSILAQTAELITLKARSNVTEKQVEVLKKASEGKTQH